MKDAGGGKGVPVVLADRFQMSSSSLQRLKELGGYIWADADSEDELAKKVAENAGTRIIVSEYVPVGEKVMRAAPSLKGVIAYGAGYNHIDVEVARRMGIVVCNCPGANSTAVAEYTFFLILSLLRGGGKADRWVRDGHWTDQNSASLVALFMGRELDGKTLGIVGLGAIGSKVARIGSGFHMNVIYYDPFTIRAREIAFARKIDGLKELARQSDVVCIHVPLTTDTRGMFGAEIIGAMKPEAVLINTSRGAVVDEEALIEALRQKRIAGAALDVFAQEPLPPDHPFIDMENVVLSPHIGGMTYEAADRISKMFVRQAVQVLSGERPEHIVM